MRKGVVVTVSCTIRKLGAAAQNAIWRLAFWTFLASNLHAEVFVAEFDATNVGNISDADGSQSDWIEIRNTGPSSVNLAGWALSNDPAVPGKWVFPSVNVAANAQLLVFASGKNWTTIGVELHTSFKLSETGSLVLSRPDGAGGWAAVTSLVNYPTQRVGVSYGFAGSTPAGAVGFFENPTPNALNGGTVLTAFVGDTSFTPNRGFFDAPFNVTVTSLTLGATIIYTTDGSEPTSTNGIQVAPPDANTAPTATINISGTTTLRARAVKAGLGQTNVDTHTYVFPALVLGQNQSYVTQPYAPWGHAKGTPNNDNSDWSMDSRVTTNSNVEDRCVTDDLKTIPTVSVVLNWTEMFGPGGIYIAGENIEKRASFEIVNPAGDKVNPNVGDKQANGTVHIFGGSSTQRWKTDKLSMRFKFWTDFSTDVLGDSAVGNYDTLVLDARLNQVWTHSLDPTQRNRGDYVRDVIMSDLENAMGNHGTHGRHVHLYINGLYWGLYTLHERPDEHFGADYLGGADDDYDVVKHNPGVANFLVAGRRINPSQPISNTNHTAGVNYQALLNLSSVDLSIQANFDAVAAKLDIPQFINYMLVNFYGGNEDWAHQNWYATYNRAGPGGKWRFHSWDAEHVFKSNNADVTARNDAGGPTAIHQKLAANLEYRRMFGDAAHTLLFNNGLFTPTRSKAVFDARLMNINEAIRGESARWGDNAGTTTPSLELHLRFSNFSGYISWWNERLRILNTILDGAANRTTSLLTQLRTRLLYPTVAAPVFSQHGGLVPANYNLTMTNPGGAGTIYFTSDGSDPRVPFTGDVAPTATPYSSAIALPGSRTIKARVRNGTTWSALNEAYFSVGTVAAAAGNLVISKIHYRPALPTAAEISAGFNDRTDFEFIEVLNISSNVVSLDGVSFGPGLDVTALPGGVRELPPGGRALFVARLAAFEFRYGTGLPVAGTFVLGANLENAGERLTLLASNGGVIVDFTYDDSAPWPASPDGTGPSLVLMKPATNDVTKGWNWRPSTGANGSPAIDDRLRLASWQSANFGPADPGYPGIAEPLADPDVDSLPNVVELFLGTAPKVPTDPAVLPATSVQLIDGGNGPMDYVVFSFRYVKAAEEISYFPETSTDLSGWESTSLVQIGNPIDHGDGTATRKYRAAQPLQTEAKRWFRLRLEVP